MGNGQREGDIALDSTFKSVHPGKLCLLCDVGIQPPYVVSQIRESAENDDTL